KGRRENGLAAVSVAQYTHSGHFLEATFENWESEFLQMALFVMLTISLRQKGSSESKPVRAEAVDREPDPASSNAPWPVRTGGWVLKIYKHSLSIVLLLLFFLSLALHFYGSLKDENNKHSLKGLPVFTWKQYLFENRFWFESFQNWQSEFLSVFAVITLSIILRQKGSPQSKPVDVPDFETGK
ncbi:MAG TPA: DUF6766 family protein, partial [Ferruginibacter sp.]|nr:DUF6766 family protein [Ferruginibacter sp.]